MKSLSVAIAGVAVASLGLAAAGQQAAKAPAAAAPAARAAAVQSAPSPAPKAGPVRTAAATPAAAHAPSMPASQQTELVKTYCATCHSEKAKAGGLSLASFDATHAQEHPELVEKMIRKVRAGMMPPAGAKRPDMAVIGSFVGSLETRMDE